MMVNANMLAMFLQGNATSANSLTAEKVEPQIIAAGMMESVWATNHGIGCKTMIRGLIDSPKYALVYACVPSGNLANRSYKPG